MSYNDELRRAGIALDTNMDQYVEDPTTTTSTNPLMDKLNTLNKSKQDKLNKFGMNAKTPEELQYDLGYALGEQVYTREDGSKFQYALNPDGTYAHDEQGNWIEQEFYGPARNLYIDDTKTGQMKVGLAAEDKGFEGRYTPDWKQYVPGLNGYGWAPGPEGVTVENGALMDVALPYSTATDLERDIHTNIGQIAERSIGTGPVSAEDELAYGSGKTEYTTQNAPLWNIDYDMSKAEIQAGTPVMDTSPFTTDSQGNIVRNPYFKERPESSSFGNAAKAFAYTVGEGIANTFDLVPEIAEYVAGNIVGDKKWSDVEGFYDEKSSKAYKEWLGYNDEVLNRLGEQASASIKRAWEKGDYWSLLKTVGDGVTTPELLTSSLGYVLGMILPGNALRVGARAATGVSKAAKALRASNPKLTRAQSIAIAEKQAGPAATISLALAGQSGYIAEAEQFGRDAEALYKETYNEEMPTEQKLLIRPLGMLYAKLDATTAKALLLAKDPVSKAIPGLLKKMPDSVQKSFVKKVAAVAGVSVARVAGAFTIEGSTEGIQTGMEKVAGKYKAGEVGVGDVLEADKYEIGGASLLGGAGGTQLAAPTTAGSAIKELAKGPSVEETREQAKLDNIEALRSTGITFEPELSVKDQVKDLIKNKPEVYTLEQEQLIQNAIDDGTMDIVNKELQEEVTKGVIMPSMLKSQAASVEEYADLLETEKQNVIAEVYELDEQGNVLLVDGKPVLNEATEALSEEEATAKINTVNEWMSEYKDVYSKEGNVLSKTVEKEADIMTVTAEDIVVNAQADKEVVETVSAGIDAKVQADDTIEVTSEYIEEVTKDALSTVDEAGNRTYVPGVTEEVAKNIARRVKNNYGVSGIAFTGINIETDPDALTDMVNEEVGLKTRNVEGRAIPQEGYAVKLGTVKDEDIETIMTEGTVDSNLVGETGSKVTSRIVDKFNEAVPGNYSTTAREIGSKVKKAIDNISDKDIAKVFKGDPKANRAKLYRLALTTMNAINAAAVSDTELRNRAEKNDSMVMKDKYYAGLTNVITQGGKDFVTSYGLKLKGDNTKLLKAHRDIGSLGVKILQEADLVEMTDVNGMWSLAGENTFTADNKKLASDIKAGEFKKEVTTDIDTDSQAVLYRDTGIKLKDANDRTSELIEGETLSYESDYGQVAKRISKLLMPYKNRVPSTEQPQGNIKVSPDITVSDKVLEKIKRLQNRPLKMKSNLRDVVKVIKSAIEKHGSIQKAINKDENLRIFLGIRDNNTLLLSNSVNGSNMSKLDWITDIAENLDTLANEDGVYYEYQVDVNNRITIRNTVANFQSDKVYARNLMTSGEYTVSNQKEKDVLIHALLDELVSKTDYDPANKTYSYSEKLEKLEKYSKIYNDLIDNSEGSPETLVDLVSIAMKPGGPLQGLKSQGGIKALSLLEGANDVVQAGISGDIITEYMPEKDASASGVFNTMMNISGRNPGVFKKILAALGVNFGEPVATNEETDAYKRLSKIIAGITAGTTASGVALNKYGSNKEALDKLVAILGKDAEAQMRELAKYPIMTWFYSAEKKTITADLTNVIVDKVITKAMEKDKATLEYLGKILGKDTMYTTDVAQIKPGSKEHKALKEEFNKIGEMYSDKLSDAFPEVANYKEDVNDIYALLASKTASKYWKIGAIKGAVPTALSKITESKGNMSVFQWKNMVANLDTTEKVRLGLSSDDRGWEMLTVSESMPNTASILPLTAHSIDAAQLILGADNVNSMNGLMTVHDAVYGQPKDLIEFQERAEQVAVEAATKYDVIEGLIEALENTAKAIKEDINKVPKESKAELISKEKLLREKAAELKKTNDVYKKDKEALLSNVTTTLFGEEGITTANTQPKNEDTPTTPEETVKNTTANKKDLLDRILDMATGKNTKIAKKAEKVLTASSIIKVWNKDIKIKNVNARKAIVEGLKTGPVVHDGIIYIPENISNYGTQSVNDVVESDKEMTENMLLDMLLHEIEHTQMDAWVDNNTNSLEYRKAVEILSELKDYKTTRVATTRASKRVQYIASFVQAGDMKQAVKELLAVSREEDVASKVLSTINKEAGISQGFVKKLISKVWDKVRRLLSNNSIEELLAEDSAYTLAVALESMRQKANTKEKVDTIVTKEDTDLLSHYVIC